jgi:hypothetical protein
MALVVPVLAGDPDPGVGNTNFTVMNLDDSATATVNADYVAPDGSVAATKSVTITPRSSSGFPIGDSGLPDGWNGSVVVSSDQPIAAFAQMRWENAALATSEDRYKTAGAYNGFVEGANRLFLPSLAQRTDRQYSRISVQSADLPSTVDTVDFTITFYDRQGNVSGSISDSVYQGAQKSYDLSTTTDVDLDPATENDWLGAAVVEADNPSDLLAVAATMHWVNYSAAYSGVTGGASKIFMPSYTRRMPAGEGTAWFQYTGVVVQNLDPSATTVVTATWYDRLGTELHVFTDTIPANSAHGYNTRFVTQSEIPTSEAAFAAAIGYDMNGSIVLESDGAEIVAVANGQWTANHPSGAGASASTAFISGDDLVFAPATFRRVSGTSWLQYTGLIVQNVGESTCNDFTVSWVDREGNELLTYTDSLGSGISSGYNTKVGGDIPVAEDPADLGVDFRGSVSITGTGCELAAIHNTLWTAWTDNTTYNAFGQ